MDGMRVVAVIEEVDPQKRRITARRDGYKHETK